jgi:hypothetical protein
MKPSRVKVAATVIIWCGLACYCLTGLLIAILLFNPPQGWDRWFGVFGLWLVATALVVGGNFFRVRALNQMKVGV